MSGVVEKKRTTRTDPILTFDDVGARLGVSARQVRRWVAEGKLEFVQLPQGRRIRESALDAWVERNTVPAEQ